MNSVTQNPWLREALKEIEYTPLSGRCIQAHGTRAGSSSGAFRNGVPIAIIKLHRDWKQDEARFETTYSDPSHITTDECHAWFLDMFPKPAAAPDWESVRYFEIYFKCENMIRGQSPRRCLIDGVRRQ